jgi:hypothetical protein
MYAFASVLVSLAGPTAVCWNPIMLYNGGFTLHHTALQGTYSMLRVSLCYTKYSICAHNNNMGSTESSKSRLLICFGVMFNCNKGSFKFL